MYLRLLDFLRCTSCRSPLALETLTVSVGDEPLEVSDGLLHCESGHWFPVVRGIPRMLPDAMVRFWPDVEPLLTADLGATLLPTVARMRREADAEGHDWRTRESFSSEWEYFELGGRTWGMDLDGRVRAFFLEPLQIPREDLQGRVVLDAGCGNGSQSVAYTEFGLEVLAVDLSSGLEHGQAYRRLRPGARPERVHFIQADLRSLALEPASVDIIHSAGVLHHTPDTHGTFRALCPYLRPGGAFYVWLYSYEPLVTPLVNTIRAFTTRLSSRNFDRLATRLAGTFQVFCKTVDRLGIRAYPEWSRDEAALALTDIFGAPYAHWHSYDEVTRWYRAQGFTEMWPVNESRRGFGVCGRLGDDVDRPGASDMGASRPSTTTVPA